jgi:hypothetical protein
MKATVQVDASKEIVFEHVRGISTDAEMLMLAISYVPCDSPNPTTKNFLCGQWRKVEIEA